MDQNPEMQGEKPPKKTAELANDRPAESVADQPKHATTIVETVTTETIKEPKPSERLAGPTATEIITETTTQTTGVVQPVVEEVKPQKKPRKGLVCLIICLLVLIIAAVGAGVWYFVYYNNPNKVAYDAVTNFLQQKTVVTSGMVNGVVNAESNDVSIVASVKSKSSGLAGENVLNLKAMILDANGEAISEHDYEVELSAIVVQDGVIYVRTDKLADTIDTLLDDMSVDTAELGDMTEIYELIDGEWWQINIPDIIDTTIGDSEIARPAKEFYACIINVANGDVNDQIAKVYHDNQFILVEKASSESGTFGLSTYAIDFDYDKMSSFFGGMMDTDYVKNTENCFNKFIVEDLGGEMDFDHTVPTADELKEVFTQMGTFTIGVDDFSHELKNMAFSYHPDEEDSGYYIVGGFEFSHPEVTISAPETYRPIDELVEMIIEVLMGMNGVPDDVIDENSALEDDEETGEWYFVDEEVDDTEKV